MDQQTRETRLEGTQCEIDIRHCKTEEGPGLRIRLDAHQATAVILYPSLTCPALVREGEPVRLLIVTEEEFYHVHQRDTKTPDFTGNRSSRMLLRRVAQHLKILPLNDSHDNKTGPLEADQPLVANTEDVHEKLSVQYLGGLAETTLQTLGGTERFMGNLRKEIIEDCLKRNLTRLFQITYRDPELTAGGKGRLYDVSWLKYQRTGKRQGQAAHEPQDEWTQAFLEQDPYIDKDSDFRYEIDVDSEYIDFTPRKERPIRNYHPVWIGPADKAVLNPGHLTDVHVSSRQHAFTRVKPQLLPGHSPELGSRVNTSFDTLRDLMDQFGEDSEIDFLFFTGDLIDYNRNYDPTPFLKGDKCTGELWKEMNLDNLNERDENGQPKRDQHGRILPNVSKYPRGIDNAVMYSLFLRFMRKYNKPVFLVAGNHEAYTVPYGISARAPIARTGKNMAKSLISAPEQPVETAVEASREDQGEHLAKLEQGQTKIGKRANEGMPADHNLSIPEAILLYGPDYNRVILGGFLTGDGYKNFKPENLDWFYTVFSPIQDFYFTWGTQCFIGLGWGDDERFLALSHGFRKGALLPWATDGVSDKQKSLVEWALREGRKTNILGCHFTLANYSSKIPIGAKGPIYFGKDSKADLAITDILKKSWFMKNPVPLFTGEAIPLRLGHYCEGTFTRNRKTIYNHVIEGRIHFTLSGHSHRAGLYRIVDDGGKWVFRYVVTKGQAPDNKSGIYEKCEPGSMIVSASGGPIPVQNHANELAGRGLDIPSGTYLKFRGDGQIDLIGVKRSRNPKARPRFAVALDYADILGSENQDIGSVFSRFEQKSDKGPFVIEVNPKMGLPETHWIKDMRIFVQTRGNIKYLNTEFSSAEPGNYKLIVHDTISPNRVGKKGRYSYYIDVHFHESLKDHDYFRAYDTSDSWIWRCEFIDRQQEAIERFRNSLDQVPEHVSTETINMYEADIRKRVSGLRAQRDGRFGEIPNLPYYSTYFGEEYAFPWKTRKKSGDPKS